MILNNKDPYRSSRIDLLGEQFLAATKTGPSDFLFVDPYSIGDLVHTLSLLSSFRKVHCAEGARINLICNPRCVPLKRFFPAIDNVFGIDCTGREFAFETLASRYRLGPGVPVVMPPDMYCQGWLARLITEGRITAIDAKKLILELDLSTELVAPELKEADREAAIAKARLQGLSPDSVIIFNHANTLASLPHESYVCLRDLFPGKVFSDTRPGSKGNIPWAKPLNIALEDLPYFAEFAGNVVAIRSGIVDLLGTTSCNLMTIYPNLAMIFDFPDREAVRQGACRVTLKNIGIQRSMPERVVQLRDSDTLRDINEAIRAACLNRAPAA